MSEMRLKLMQICIVFFKSSSKYYDSCCLQCEKFDGYLNEKNTNTVIVEDEEIRLKKSVLNTVLLTVKNWSKTEYYIDGNSASALAIERLLELLDCEKAKTEEVVGDHCYDLNGWGCNHLEDISFCKDEHSYYCRNKYYWYQFGRFIDGTWNIDKERIKRVLKDEVERKHLSFCRCFNINRIYSEIEKLPEAIVVDENNDKCGWQYVYKEAPAGMKQTEIIGVEPKKEEQSLDGGFSISFKGLLKEDKYDEEENDVKNVPSVTFDDIGGMDDIVQQVREVIELPMISPRIFEHYHLVPHKGILLYGPPGCGKTMIAKAIANEINAHFIAVNGPEILNKFIGESEANLRKVFEEAKKKTPSIIYFDEFDSISTRRDNDDHLSSSTIVNQLLTLMDGMAESKVCCIASTNRIDMIDEAIKRPGRFDYVIEIEKPSPEGCKTIFRIHTENKPVDLSFNKERFVDKYLIGLTGAEIAFVAAEAAYNSIRRTINIKDVFLGKEVALSDKNTIIDIDFIKAVKTLKERKTKADSAKYRYNM